MNNVCACVCVFGRHTCIVDWFLFQFERRQKGKRAIECITPRAKFHYIILFGFIAVALENGAER